MASAQALDAQPSGDTPLSAEERPSMLPSEPATYPRRVLLAVTGLSPQVVTETLYALTQEAEPPFVPTEIYLVTTADGAEHARLMLLDPEDGRYYQFCAEYGIDPEQVAFDASHIHSVSAPDGQPLHDITKDSDNTAVADAITELVSTLTADEACAVHASIAGGRKTMGFYLGYALSLYGRPQDRLSHVLVSEPFESDHQFYYPPARPKRLIIKDRPVHTSEAKVMLADIPFVRLRHGLDESLRAGRLSFSETVAAAQRRLGPAELVIDLDEPHIRAGAVPVQLSPRAFAFYAWLAVRRGRNNESVQCPADGAPELGYGQELIRYFGGYLRPQTRKRLEHGMDKAFFLETKSKLNSELKQQLGLASVRYQVQKHGRGPAHFGLFGLEPERIYFETAAED